MRRHGLLLIVFAALVPGLMGHTGGCCDPSGVRGPPTETVCPDTGTSLTYNNFGKPFVETYCTKCHHSELSGAARMGAPKFHDFDTLIGIKQVSNHVDETAGSGPGATNKSMPPSGHMQPSLAEREMLAEWIACNMPE